MNINKSFIYFFIVLICIIQTGAVCIKLKLLFKVVRGLEEVASNEIFEKLNADSLTPSPYGQDGWIKCEIKQFLFDDIKQLRSV